MGTVKTIRDPMYGYITIEEPFAQLIDTEEFQRLRNIRQTGYQSLYPSALHNRFVHSLGVFYLGKKALGYFEKNVNITEECADWKSIKMTFLVACLLHDVGHSPFSHTGEDYYTKGCSFSQEYAKKMNYSEEWGQSQGSKGDKELKVQRFFGDLAKSTSGTGKPHEAMSTLLGVDLCKKLGIGIDEDLFIRAIIGLKYKEGYEATNKIQVIKNAMICLLNGDLIDVDKLDYVIRDAYVTGYNSLTLDLERLLAGYTIVETTDHSYEVAFKKGALSVIENVIYANDLERRWIQSHPAILYDCWLVEGLLVCFDEYAKRRIMEAAQAKKDKPASVPALRTIYTKEALSAEGISEGDYKLRLLCDDDIICYGKNIDDSFFSKQYFARFRRYKPLWKTEATFEHLTSGVFGNRLLVEISKVLQSLAGFGPTSNGILINAEFKANLEEQMRKADKSDIKGISSASYQQALDMCNVFTTFVEEQGLADFEFVVLFTRRFQSAYRKTVDLNNMKVELETGLVPLNDVISVQAKEVNKNNKLDLFYVYTTANNISEGRDLGKLFIDCLRRTYKSLL